MREDLVLQACLEAYGAVRHEGRLADRALEFALRKKRNLYSAERREVAERVYALLRRQLTVDHLLTKVRPGFAALSPTAQDALRLAASRLLGGAPLNEVANTSSLPGEEARALRALPEALEATQELPPVEQLSVRASLPVFLAEQFLEEFGPDAEAVAAAMNARAPLTARVNTLKLSREALRQRLREEGVETEFPPYSPLGLWLDARLNAFALASFQDGAFEIQDEGSQLLGMLVDAPPTRVVDACAGAGGKTLQLAAQMKNRGELFALDVDERRLDDLRKRARRAGVHNVRVRPLPPTEPGPVLRELEGKADRVLVDAPCSGSGTFRRKPDARYRLSPEDLRLHSERQRLLLARFSALVKVGGRLIYGTCSVLREENEAVVEHFLSQHPGFRVVPARELLPGDTGPKLTRGDFLRLSPHVHGTDGFFGAVMQRER